MITQKVEFFLSEHLGEYVNIFFRGKTVFQISDPIMNRIYDVMHMDLDVFCSLSLHWVFAKIQSDMIVTPNDSHMMELDTKLNEENM